MVRPDQTEAERSATASEIHRTPYTHNPIPYLLPPQSSTQNTASTLNPEALSQSESASSISSSVGFVSPFVQMDAQFELDTLLFEMVNAKTRISGTP